MMKFTAKYRLKLLGSGMTMLLAGCGGGGGTSPDPVSVSPQPVAPTPAPPSSPTPSTGVAGDLTEGLFRDTFRNNFKIGAALTSYQLDNADVNPILAASQFNSVTPSFQLKADTIAPTEGVFDFEEADRIVDWAISNGMDIRGHALVWHESTPDYFYEGTRDEIRARLETYITTVVEHFRGRIGVWDVVNEVVSVDIFSGDAGVGPDRQSRWFEAVGNADYVDWAFQAARAADPDALLFLNEYSTDDPIKQPWLLEILQRLQDRNVPIDGVGHQFHLFLGSDSDALMGAIDSVDNQFMGMINHVTELDVDFYNDPGSCWSEQVNCDADFGTVAPPELLATQAQLMRDVYAGLRERSSVVSVTTWGAADNESWLNRSPVARFNYPLLFDREGEPKPAFWAVVDSDYVIPTE